MVSIPAYTPPLDDVTTALLDLFRLADGTVYDGAYNGNPVKVAYPYRILYPIPGGSSDPFPDLDLDRRAVTASWQLTAVSNYRNQAERTARISRDLLLARADGDWLYPIDAPDGWQILTRRPDDVMPGVLRSGDAPTAVWSAPIRFTLTLAPA